MISMNMYKLYFSNHDLLLLGLPFDEILFEEAD